MVPPGPSMLTFWHAGVTWSFLPILRWKYGWVTTTGQTQNCLYQLRKIWFHQKIRLEWRCGAFIVDKGTRVLTLQDQSIKSWAAKGNELLQQPSRSQFGFFNPRFSPGWRPEEGDLAQGFPRSVWSRLGRQAPLSTGRDQYCKLLDTRTGLFCILLQIFLLKPFQVRESRQRSMGTMGA